MLDDASPAAQLLAGFGQDELCLAVVERGEERDRAEPREIERRAAEPARFERPVALRHRRERAGDASTSSASASSSARSTSLCEVEWLRMHSRST